MSAPVISCAMVYSKPSAPEPSAPMRGLPRCPRSRFDAEALAGEFEAPESKGGPRPPGSRATPRGRPSGRFRDGAPSYDKGNKIAQHARLPNEACADHNSYRRSRQGNSSLTSTLRWVRTIEG